VDAFVPATTTTSTPAGKTNLDHLLEQAMDICRNIHQRQSRKKVEGLDKIFEDITAILSKEHQNPHDFEKVRTSGAFDKIVKAICSVDGFARPNLPPK
jgi:hypothetical protein